MPSDYLTARMIRCVRGYCCRVALYPAVDGIVFSVSERNNQGTKIDSDDKVLEFLERISSK